MRILNLAAKTASIVLLLSVGLTQSLSTKSGIMPVVAAAMPESPQMDCAEVIGYGLRSQGSIFWRRVSVINAIQVNLGISDDRARAELNADLKTIAPNSGIRQRLVEDALVVLELASQDAACQEFSVAY